MRKRVLISVILLLLAMTVSIVSYVLLQNRFSALGEALQNAVYADAPIETSCGEIEKQWQKSAALTQIFLLHSDLADLRTALESLPDLKETPLLYRETCIRALHLLNGVRDSLAPSIENSL